MMMQFKNQHQYCYTPEDDPRKWSKHVALPPEANKTNADTVVCILFFSELLLSKLSHYISFVSL
jgi:hypothetical protein